MTMEKNVLVNRARLVPLNRASDSRGVLYPFEFDALPFQPRRCFVVTEVPAGSVRGRHAHRTCTQLLICLIGRVDVTIKHGGQSAVVTLLPGAAGLLIEPETFSEQTYLTDDATLMVFADESFDPASYIYPEGDVF